jgi:hypothetical protein
MRVRHIPALVMSLCLAAGAFGDSTATGMRGLVEVQPAWALSRTGAAVARAAPGNTDENSYGLYDRFCQRHILSILNERSIRAIPSLYTSAL